MKAAIDPKLERALKTDQRSLNIFAKLKVTQGSPDLSARAEAVVNRVARKTQQTPRFQFRNLDSVLHVNANRAFIRELLRQPEIAGASMVPDVTSALIPPLNPHEVDESEIAEPTFPRRRSRSGR